MFGHEKFGAYKYSMEFAALAAQIIERLPTGYGKLIDQFRRASISVSLNIAEGSGKISEPQRHNCYAIARGEAMECAAIMDILECMHMVDCGTVKKAKELLENVVAILTSVCKRKHEEGL